jgi:outer membrane protein assembly factor BamB/SAM-dependent methyltransferase
MRWSRADLIAGCVLALGVLIGGEPACEAAPFDEDAGGVVSVVPADRGLAELRRDSGIWGGVIVHVGCGDGRATAALVRHSTDRVQGLDRDPASIELARQHALPLGLDGRLTFRTWRGGGLPYTDSLVNVLVWERAAGEADWDEISRVLAPGGTAYLRTDAGWEKRVQPWPEDICDWTHFRADAGATGASSDRRVGPPSHLRWEAGPRVLRSHEIESGISGMVSANGRLYFILDEGPIGVTDARFPPRWSLVCRDAFNGVLLWKRPLPTWGWQSWRKPGRENIPQQWLGTRTRPADVDRLLAADQDAVYVTLGFGAPFSAIDGRTGEVLRTYAQTEGASELIVLDGVLLVRTDRPEPSVLALRAADGHLLWRHAARPIVSRSLAAAADRVFFHTRDELVALDLHSGDELWRHETQLRPAMVVAQPDTVLVVQSQAVWALSAETGEVRWKSPGVQIRGRSPDLFVVEGRVWYGRPHFHARDLVTGEVVQKLDLQQVLKSGHHRRCYADRATVNFMISGERGSEFLALCDDDHSRHNWFRGPCIQGMLPANGLFYVPPHQCFCYPAVRMDGFFALAAADGDSRLSAKPSVPPRLEQGPAYGLEPDPVPDAPGDWPTYRQNAWRGGAVSTQIPQDLQPLWSRHLGGRLTQAVVAGGRAFVAQRDAGVLHCLDLLTGEPVWSRSAAGGIDSPPTLVGGLAIFGSRDGCVYCLRADDGRLVWRFHAAPEDRQVVCYDRLESVWPVHGSLLLLDGLVYGAAGRSGFLDGGISLFALQPASGKLVHETRLEGPWPDIGQPSYAFHKDGYRADLLTTDGQHLYMGRTVLDRELAEVEAQRVRLTGTQRGDQLEYRIMPGMRLVATGGFLDDTFWNRTWWMYSYVWPGFHYAQQAPKSGQLLVFDDQNTYTVKHYTTRNRHSPMLFPGNEYLVFADANENEPLFYRGEGEPAPIEWEVELPADTRWTIHQDAAVDKGPGFTRAHPALWTSWVDVRVEAMVLAGQHLVLAGVPDVVPADYPLAGFDGRLGGVLQVLRASDGKIVADYPLEVRPVFDGLIAAQGRVLLSTEDGSVLCLGEVAP